MKSCSFVPFISVFKSFTVLYRLRHSCLVIRTLGRVADGGIGARVRSCPQTYEAIRSLCGVSPTQKNIHVLITRLASFISITWNVDSCRTDWFGVRLNIFAFAITLLPWDGTGIIMLPRLNLGLRPVNKRRRYKVQSYKESALVTNLTTTQYLRPNNIQRSRCGYCVITYV